MKMYAMTHINKDGHRVLTFSNQEKNHFKTEAEGLEGRKNFILHNRTDSLEMVFGKQSTGTFEIREIDTEKQVYRKQAEKLIEERAKKYFSKFDRNELINILVGNVADNNLSKSDEELEKWYNMLDSNDRINIV